LAAVKKLRLYLMDLLRRKSQEEQKRRECRGAGISIYLKETGCPQRRLQKVKTGQPGIKKESGSKKRRVFKRDHPRLSKGKAQPNGRMVHGNSGEKPKRFRKSREISTP